MRLDPWTYVEISKSEHAHQVALFMWANMAANFGLKASLDLSSYKREGVALAWLNQCDDKVDCLRWLHAIKNAGHGDVVRGARSKAEGVKAGVPDIFLPCSRYYQRGQFHGLYVELKRLKSARGAAGVTSKVQNEWHQYLTGAGYQVEVCYGWIEARDAILRYLRLDTA